MFNDFYNYSIIQTSLDSVFLSYSTPHYGTDEEYRRHNDQRLEKYRIEDKVYKIKMNCLSFSLILLIIISLYNHLMK